MFEPMFKPNPPLFVCLNKARKNARQVQIRKCFPQPLKERLDEGRGRKTLSEIEIGFLFHQKRRRPRMAYGACYLKGTRFFDRGVVWLPGPLLVPPAGLLGRIAVWGLCLPFLIKNSGLARESAGNKRKEGVHVAAAPAPFLVNGAAGSASTTKERIHFR